MMRSFLLLFFITITFSHKHSFLFSGFDIANYNSQLVEKFDANFRISASPNIIKESAGNVIVTFGLIENPTEDDWIGVYSPSDVDIKTTSPVKYKFAKVSPNYLRDGHGSVIFRLLNMRNDYSFVFFRNGTKHPIAVGKSNSISFSNYYYPEHGRLSLTNNPNQMRITWVSKDRKIPRVEWREEGSHTYTHHSIPKSYTYSPADMCGEPATTYGWREPGIIHSAVMDNLIPNRRYYYRYGDVRSGGWSEEGSFIAPPVSTAQRGVRMGAYGDMGKAEEDHSEEHWEQYPSLNTTKNILKRIGNLDLVLHIGDISYAVGYSAQWDEFLAQIHPVASKVPYMTCIGNHERDYLSSGAHYNGTDSGGECGIPYESHFPMPTPGKDKPYYGFDYGNVHVTMMSTEHNFDIGSEQHSFLNRDLASVNRTRTPWVIFAGHRPMYVDSTDHSEDGGDQTVATELRKNLEPLLLKYRVDLALWGHHHSYQRTCHVYQEKCTSEGTVHVIIGMAGMGLSQNIEEKMPSWDVYVDDQEYGYSIIETTEKTLHMQYFNNDNVLKDQFVLHK